MYRIIGLKLTEVLLACLLEHDAARVTAPTANEIEAYKEAITRKYPRIRIFLGACDGLKLQIEESGNWFIQNLFYNRWTHGNYVNCKLVFGANGRIQICVINTPGTWHDSTQADHGVYGKIKKRTMAMMQLLFLILLSIY